VQVAGAGESPPHPARGTGPQRSLDAEDSSERISAADLGGEHVTLLSLLGDHPVTVLQKSPRVSVIAIARRLNHAS
jgi:hypothetical protein